jgi:hypothetical protein
LIPDGDDELAADTRRARRHGRRRRTRRGLILAGAIVGVLALTGSALALTGVVEIGDESPSAGAGAGGAGSPDTTSASAAGVSTAEHPCRSQLNPLDPLRLWIGGDSLAGSLGPSLGRMTADTGVVQPVFFSKVSSGLSTPDFWDWPEHGAEEMFKLDPEIAVFIVGANDTMIIGDNGDEWRPRYEQAVEEMMTLLIGENRTVYWVGTPVLENDDSLLVAQLNEVFQEVAARHPELVYVDAYGLFATPEGEFTDSVTDAEGETILVRADDGVHFTPEGGDHLANAIFPQLDAQCALLAQAVSDAAKDVIETEGSSRVPGTSREEDTTVTTRPPATVATTAPPATSPPTTAAPTTAPPASTAPPVSSSPPLPSL